MKPSRIIGIVVIVVVLGAGGYLVLRRGGYSAPKSNAAGANQTPADAANLPSVNNTVLATKSTASLGKYLTDPSGKPLYTYDADRSGVSNCTNACLSNWPAYTATGSTTGLPAGVSTIKRSDNGQTQYIYNGMPLYYFTADSGSAPTGDGVEDFAIARPAASSSSDSSSSSANTGGSGGAADAGAGTGSAASASDSSSDDW